MSASLMEQDMAAQPAVLAALAARREQIVESLAGPAPAGIVIVARGSSDHAGIFGRYLLEVATGLPVALAAPSLQTLYGVRPRVEGWLAVAISQSGRTPEIATVLERFRDAGARAVAVTNDPDSPLARGASVHVALDAGEERAVPATKTFTAQLAAMALVAEALGPSPLEPPTGSACPASSRSFSETQRRLSAWRCSSRAWTNSRASDAATSCAWRSRPPSSCARRPGCVPKAGPRRTSATDR